MVRVLRFTFTAVATLVFGIVTSVGILWLFGERWRPVRRSTIGYFRSAGMSRWLEALHGYVYVRWSNQYIGIGLGQVKTHRRVFQHWSADSYHGKVLTHDLARQFLVLDHDLDLPDQEQVIPYPTARDIVVRNPKDIAIYNCPCRQTRENPCLPLDVCMIVGQPFVDFIVEHNPRSARRITQNEALAILEAEHERGHMHTAYFKDAMEGRFYAICNCCQCCCGAVEVMMRGGIPMISSSGYIAEIDADECIACGECEEACPFGAIHVNGTAVVDTTLCMGCGVCQVACDLDLPTLIRDERKPLPLDIKALEAQAVKPLAQNGP
ncbi:MAG: 4Fe-4S binding protein [Chloroflexota bacterium]|nr:4Fe-4S binding protein [Chloroflexota bacterium]